MKKEELRPIGTRVDCDCELGKGLRFEITNHIFNPITEIWAEEISLVEYKEE